MRGCQSRGAGWVRPLTALLLDAVHWHLFQCSLQYPTPEAALADLSPWIKWFQGHVDIRFLEASNEEVYNQTANIARAISTYLRQTRELPLELLEIVHMLQNPSEARLQNKRQRIAVYRMGSQVVVESERLYVPLTVMSGVTLSDEVTIVGIARSPRTSCMCIVYDAQISGEAVLRRIQSLSVDGTLYKGIADDAYLASALVPMLRRCLEKGPIPTIELGNMVEIGSHEWDINLRSGTDGRLIRLRCSDHLNTYVRLKPIVSKMWRPLENGSSTNAAAPKYWWVHGEVADGAWLTGIECDDPGALYQQAAALGDRAVEPYGTAEDGIYIYKVTPLQEGQARPKSLAPTSLTATDIQEELNKCRPSKVTFGPGNNMYLRHLWQRLTEPPREIPVIQTSDFTLENDLAFYSCRLQLSPFTCLSHMRQLAALEQLLKKLNGAPFSLITEDCEESVVCKMIDVTHNIALEDSKLNSRLTVTFQWRSSALEKPSPYLFLHYIRRWLNEQLADKELWESPAGMLFWKAVNCMFRDPPANAVNCFHDIMKVTRYLLESVEADHTHEADWEIDVVHAGDNKFKLTIRDRGGDSARALVKLGDWAHIHRAIIHRVRVIDDQIEIYTGRKHVCRLIDYFHSNPRPYEFKDAAMIANLLRRWFSGATKAAYMSKIADNA